MGIIWSLVILGAYVHAIFYWLLLHRKQIFDAPMFGLFTLGVTVAAIGFFNPHSVKLPDGTVLTRLEEKVIDDKAHRVSLAVESVIKAAPQGKPDPEILEKNIEAAQVPTKLEVEVSNSSGRVIQLPKKSVVELSKELAETKDEDERREKIMKTYLGIYQPENPNAPKPPPSSLMDIFSGRAKQ